MSNIIQCAHNISGILVYIMIHYKFTSNTHKFSRPLTLSVILVCVRLFLPIQNIFANEQQQIQQIQNQIQNSYSVLQSLDEEISQYQQQLNQVAGDRRTLESAVRELDITDKKIQATIQATYIKIENTEKNLKSLDFSIEELEERIDRNKYLIRQTIQEMNRIESQPIAFALILEKNFGDTLRLLAHYNQMQFNFSKEIHAFRDNLDSFGAVKRTQEEERIQFEKLAAQQQGEKKSLERVKREKSQLLQETRSEEQGYQAIITEKNKLKEQFENSLQELESRLTVILDPTSFPAPRHGIFSWPLDTILITQGFGLTPFSERLYSYRSGSWSGRHTGVDFRANNDPVYAMGSGTVTDFGNTDLDCPRASFGGWMLIHYDNGLSSIYSHLSSFVAQKGDRVSSGTLVAISGNTGYSTGPHLDVKVVPTSTVTVETWPSNACPGKFYRTPLVAGSNYLDPLGYLPFATDSMFR